MAFGVPALPKRLHEGSDRLTKMKPAKTTPFRYERWPKPDITTKALLSKAMIYKA
jgi:hypothetical protein